MKIILSPAKKMNNDTDTLLPLGMPVCLGKTEEILKWLQGRSPAELKRLWKCNDKIAEQNYDRISHMDLFHSLTPAILSYEGIAYQYMAPGVFENDQYDYIQEHLRILSAFYGVLKPMDGVKPYRLEMQAKAAIGTAKDLYDFWGKSLYSEVLDDSRIIINLASKEYSRCIEKYLTGEDRYITVTFCEKATGIKPTAEKSAAEKNTAEKSTDEKATGEKAAVEKAMDEKSAGTKSTEKSQNNKLVTKGTYAKMARGEMVRYMAEMRIENPEDIRKFDRLGYVFRENLSSDTEYVFERVTG